MENIEKESIETIATSGPEDNCTSVTCDAFSDGLDFVGLFIQIVTFTVIAVALIIAFYISQKELERRKKK